MKIVRKRAIYINMYTWGTQIFMMFFNNPPSNPKDWLLSASVTHGSIMLDPSGCTVQDAQVKGAAASVVRGGAIVPDDHHLLWTLKVSDRANMALSAILLAPLPIWPPDNSNPNPLHHQPAASGRRASDPRDGVALQHSCHVFAFVPSPGHLCKHKLCHLDIITYSGIGEPVTAFQGR